MALGGSILERHFTDSMSRPGPDIVCSMDPAALSELIEGSKILYSARGGDKGAIAAESPTIAFAFASVVAIKNIEPGELLTRDNIWVMRPGGGDFLVSDYDGLLGKIAKFPIKSGYQVKKSDLEIFVNG